MADGDKEKAAEADSTPIVAKSEKDRQQAEAQPQPQPQPNNEQEPNAAQQSSKGGGAAAASEEEGRRRRQAFLRQASLPSFNARKPRLVHCWLHGSDGAKIWSAFGPRDSRALEKAWQTWQCETNGGSSARGNEERGKEFTSGEEADGIRGSDGADGEETKIGAANAKHARSNAQGEDPVPSDSSSRSDNLLSPPDPDVPLPTWRVPVMEDHLFEVDLRNMRLWSVFWKTKPSEVMRARWFFDSPKISPCTDAVASELDSLYDSIQPWLSSYADELRSSVALGSDAEDKLKAPLTTLKGSYVIFLGPSLARIYSDDVSSRITKTLWTTWSGAHNGGTLVARGFDVAQNLLQTQESNGTSTPTRNAKRASTAVKRTADSKGAHTPTRSIDSSKTEAVANEEGSDGTQTPKEDSSIQQTGAAKPNIGSDEAEEASKQDCDSKEANNNADTYSADAMRSWVTSKFGSWAASAASPNVSEQMSGKTQKDIKEAFHEAQSRAQGYMHDQQRRTMERDLARDKVVSEQMAEAMDTAAVADGEETAQPAHTEEEEYQREVGLDNEPLDLVLVWHGIGQKIAEEWKSLDFTLAVTNLRNLTRKRAGLAPPSDVGGKGLSELTKGRRVQMLPVMWRATLEDFEPTARDGDAHPDEHLDNNFTIDDIFSDTMPIIKQLISGVLFDIPLYLSHHREEIMSRVVRENNRIVRLFLQRNPRFFDNGGRISLIAHSLGAALATDVLSAQPTKARTYSELPSPGSELAFDVHNLYLVGSPVALFMWINKAQLIARRGRELTQESPIDEALDRAGRWGCLAVDRIFNVFSASDPIGTRLNSTVDAPLAKQLKSVPLARAVKSILRTLPDTLAAPAASSSSSIFSGWKRAGTRAASSSRPSSVAGGEAAEEMPDDAEGLFQGEGGKSQARAARTSAFGLKWKDLKGRVEKKSSQTNLSANPDPSKEEEREQSQKSDGSEWDIIRGKSDSSGATQTIPAQRIKSEASPTGTAAGERDRAPPSEKSRGTRRINALCEFGCVDFVIPSSASLLSNQYMDLLWSHASYWTEPSFADFVLATLSSSPERLRLAGTKLLAEP